jgi:hypothetical protein
MTLTVVCVFVQGNVPYTMEYVERLYSMTRRHISRAHKFVCLTDQPSNVPKGVWGIDVKTPPGCFGWWAKVSIFDPELPFEDRVLYLDLDTLIVKPLDPIIDYAASFALIPTAGTFEGRNGLHVVKRYNSSCMVFDARSWQARRLWEHWSPKVAKRLWGDQDYIGEELPNESRMPLSWFPRLSEIFRSRNFPHDAKVVLCKKPKNHIAAAQWPWFKDLWR